MEAGDTVKKGDLLVSFDINQIKEEGYSIETPVVITNTDNYLDIIETKNKSVEAGEELLTVIH